MLHVFHISLFSTNDHEIYCNENHGIIERVKFCEVRLQPLSFTKRFAFCIVFLSCVSLRLLNHTLWTGRDRCLQGRDHCSTPFIILRRTKSFPSLSFYLNIKLRCHKFAKSLFAIHSEIRAGVGSQEEVLAKRKLPFLFYFVLSA